ncbi:uncharacterized protein [Dermacentor albipictus]|uniref:uncharacterized protein n=1 Tax=Dermacentor albipictus TaxID=60249 RepID=UPI0038FCBC41
MATAASEKQCPESTKAALFLSVTGEEATDIFNMFIFAEAENRNEYETAIAFLACCHFECAAVISPDVTALVHSPPSSRSLGDSAGSCTNCPISLPDDSLDLTATTRARSPGIAGTLNRPLTIKPSPMTSTIMPIYSQPDPSFFSGQGGSSTSIMLTRCLFLTQLAVCISRLLQSGDIESNPGPRSQKNPSLSQGFDDQPSVSEMLAELLNGQKRLAEDIAEIKNFQQSVNTRFETIESRLAALESSSHKPAVPSDSLNNDTFVIVEKKNLPSVNNTLKHKNDELENRARRNNLILHGLPEFSDEGNERLSSDIAKWFENKLKMSCPQIERCHRLGRRSRDRPRPVIMKLLDYREKVSVLKSGHRLKETDYRISEDFSLRVRNTRKKLWEASESFRNNGCTVRIRFDHIFIDKVRYNWNSASNTLEKVHRNTALNSVAPASPP